jgi:hypothetical protein
MVHGIVHFQQTWVQRPCRLKHILIIQFKMEKAKKVDKEFSESWVFSKGV